MESKSRQVDEYIITLARPADVLCTQVRLIAIQDHCKCLLCSSVYEVILHLRQIPPEHPGILITRPAMLAKPHLCSALQQYPNLRLIGWLNPDEAANDSAFGAIGSYGIVMVSNTKQLHSVIAALRKTWGRDQVHNDPDDAKQNAGITTDEYTLSDDELNALLGAG